MSAAATEVGSSNRGAMSAVSVEVGGSRQASSDFAERVAAMVNSAYGYDRISSSEVKQRLAMGDAGLQANRVLHLAWRDGCLVGAYLSSPLRRRGPVSHVPLFGLLSVDLQRQASRKCRWSTSTRAVTSTQRGSSLGMRALLAFRAAVHPRGTSGALNSDAVARA
jgi:hypothetical protein